MSGHMTYFTQPRRPLENRRFLRARPEDADSCWRPGGPFRRPDGGK